MADRFRKKPVVIEAHQWHKNGDHPLDYSKAHDGFEGGEYRLFTAAERKANGWEGDIVRYYRRPDDKGDRACEHCGQTMHQHGWIDTLEGGHNVCPGDWIITGIKGEMYPCKPDIFEATYEVAGDDAGPCDNGDQWKPALLGLMQALREGRAWSGDARHKAATALLRRHGYDPEAPETWAFVPLPSESKTFPMSDAEVCVLNERRRQIEVERFNHAHDDEHGPGTLARAAACYAEYVAIFTPAGVREEVYRAGPPTSAIGWPWEIRFWKPKSPRQDLVRAAALLIAEIERIDRAAAAPSK